MRRQLNCFAGIAGVAVAGTLVWTMAAGAGSESAEYKVLESDGAIEIREYPDLILAATDSEMDAQGRDGSFMRLFRYISGANEAEQEIAMTTPVFMEGENGKSDRSMGFVLPKEVAAKGAPVPKREDVKLRKRKGGRFAVIRFSGRLDSKLAKEQEAKLREWIESRGLEGHDSAETAGYDPPFTPPPLRRNEILIRLKESSENAADASGASNDR